MRFGCLSAREQGAVRMWWRSRGEGEGEEGEVGSISAVQGTSSTSPPFSSRSLASPSPRPNANTDLFSPSGLLTLYIISRLSGHISRLSWLADAYDSTTFTSDNSALPTLFEAFEEEETEVWRIASGLGPDAEGEALTVSAEIWADESEEISLALEARLLALEPASSYSETKRQRALTEGEGDVWELAFGSVSLESAPEAGEEGVGACSDLALGLTAALAQLDGLRADAPAVRATYVSNLIVPLESEHAACRDLLRKMGVPVLLAPVPFEAEGVASVMALRGEVDFVGTEDSDVIVYGVSRS
jgi:flap endonuclease-1